MPLLISLTDTFRPVGLCGRGRPHRRIASWHGLARQWLLVGAAVARSGWGRLGRGLHARIEGDRRSARRQRAIAAVTLVFWLRREVSLRDATFYVGAQVSGGIVGTIAAHAMFALPLLDASLKVRTGGAQWLAEAIAAFGLVVTILAGIRFARPSVPWLVGLYITTAYWFTSSTSFANPAVAIARSLTNTFSGIRPAHLAGFIAAELSGAVAAPALMNWLLQDVTSSAATIEEART